VNNKSIVYGKQVGTIRKLKDFSSSHHLPNEFNDTTNAFVQKAGKIDIENLASEILDIQRKLFNLKRIDYSMDSQFGRVVVETPQVHFSVSIALNPEALKQYIITVEVTALKTDSQEEQSLLLDSLSPYCSILSIEAENPISVEETIDAIEAVDALRPILEYPSDASCCTLRFESLNLTIEIDSQNWVLEPIIPMGLSDFIKKAEEALSKLNDSNATFVAFSLFA
tara:strand:+ start:62 stop:736 length:675 start_codon:yes stop_codon:yes gene_type:complete